MNKKIETSTQFLLCAFLIYCTLLVGSSWDEIFNMTRGYERLKYLFSLGSYESHFYYSDNEQFYPGLYDTLAIFVTKMFPKKYEIEIWHLTNSLFSLLCIFGIYKLSSTLFNKHVGKIIFLLCFFNPIFFGHMAMNPKDTIIAFANIWSTYIFIRYLQCQSRNDKRKHYIWLAGLTLGLGTGVRILFFVTLIPLILFALLDIFFMKKITNSGFSIKKFFVDLFLIFIIAYFLTIAAWPHVHTNIFSEPFKLFLAHLKNPFGVTWILFDGNFHETDKLPYYYIIKNFFYKSPEYILLCYASFICLIAANKKFFFSKFDFFGYKILLIVFIFLFPTIILFFFQYRIYDGLRLFLYLIPYFCVIPGLLVYYLIINYKKNISKILLTAIFSLFVFNLFIFFKLTPYQYTYLNMFNGNFSKAHEKFENDYWVISLKELINQIPNNKKLLNNEKLRLAFCGVPDDIAKLYLKKINNFQFKQVNWLTDDFDYIIMTNRVVLSNVDKNIVNEDNLINVQTCFDKLKGIDVISVKRNGLILSTLRKKI